jgi:hypothetical protein
MAADEQSADDVPWKTHDKWVWILQAVLERQVHNSFGQDFRKVKGNATVAWRPKRRASLFGSILQTYTTTSIFTEKISGKRLHFRFVQSSDDSKHVSLSSWETRRRGNKPPAPSEVNRRGSFVEQSKLRHKAAVKRARRGSVTMEFHDVDSYHDTKKGDFISQLNAEYNPTNASTADNDMYKPENLLRREAIKVRGWCAG